jgi:hypothetical protein
MAKLKIAGQVFEKYTEIFRFTNEGILELETTYRINGTDVAKDDFLTKMHLCLQEFIVHENHPNHSSFSGKPV